jgi:hypothetical protein
VGVTFTAHLLENGLSDTFTSPLCFDGVLRSDLYLKLHFYPIINKNEMQSPLFVFDV